MPAVGDMAPDFTLDTDAGTPLTLSALRGRVVVLFFYPKCYM
jgi:peroxiredoxin Q/BCP